MGSLQGSYTCISGSAMNLESFLLDCPQLSGSLPGPWHLEQARLDIHIFNSPVKETSDSKKRKKEESGLWPLQVCLWGSDMRLGFI